MTKFFEALKAGLEEAVAYRQGKIKLHEEIIEIPEVRSDQNSENFEQQVRMKENNKK